MIGTYEGQAYRKGGLWGSKAWREDEMDFVAISMQYGFQVFDIYNQYLRGYSWASTAPMHTAYGVTSHFLYSPNFYSVLGPGEHFEGISMSGHIQVRKSFCASLIDVVL